MPPTAANCRAAPKTAGPELSGASPTSNTMGATDDVAPSNFVVAKNTTTAFARTLPAGMKLGLVSYARTASVRAAPSVDRPAFIDAIDQLMLVNTTSAPQSAIETAVRQIQASGKGPGWIVLISDGKQPMDEVADDQEMGYFAARVSRHWGIPNLTISLGANRTRPGSPSVEDDDMLAGIASLSGGRMFAAQTEAEMTQAFAEVRGIVTA